MNGMYDAVLTAKHPTRPSVASSTPAIAGPEDARQVELDRVEREAGRDRSGSTIDGTIDWYDGIDSASVTPTTSASATTIHGAIQPVATSTTSASGHSIWMRLEQRDHPTPIGVVGEHAADQREHPLRRIEHERVEPDHERRRAEIEQQPRLCDLLRPEPEVRQQRREPQRAESARPEQRERPVEPRQRSRRITGIPRI